MRVVLVDDHGQHQVMLPRLRQVAGIGVYYYRNPGLGEGRPLRRGLIDLSMRLSRDHRFQDPEGWLRLNEWHNSFVNAWIDPVSGIGVATCTITRGGRAE